MTVRDLTFLESGTPTVGFSDTPRFGSLTTRRGSVQTGAASSGLSASCSVKYGTLDEASTRRAQPLLAAGEDRRQVDNVIAASHHSVAGRVLHVIGAYR